MPGAGFEPATLSGEVFKTSVYTFPPPGPFAHIASFRTDVPPAIRRCLTMTVRAQQPQVLQPVVRVVTVDVIEFERKRRSAPLGDTALGAAESQETGAHQPLPQARRLIAASGDEYFGERPRRHYRNRITSTPRLTREVGRIEPQTNDGVMHRSIVPAERREAECAQDASHASRGRDRLPHCLIRPPRLPAGHLGSADEMKKNAGPVTAPGPAFPFAPERETGLEPATPTLARLCSTN
jgi:hypothetical protein